MSDRDFELKRFFQPIELSTFFNEYWEKSPLLLSREEPNYYSNLVTKGDLDSIICFNKTKFQQVVNKGQTLIPNHSNPYENHNVSNIFKAYSEGNTIVLCGLQHCWQPVSIFCRSLESFFSHPIHINLYLTPKSSQGLLPHFDTHDVFILQVEGSKHWRVYDSFRDLPLSTDEHSSF